MVASSAGTPRVAIVGGGIGGVVAAAFLRRAGLPAVVYEQASELGEVGAGLVLAPNAVRLLRRLGVMGRLAGRAVPLDVGWEFRRWENGQVLSSEDLAGSCERLYGERTYTVHRADLLSAIASAVPAGTVQLARQCASVSVSGDGAVLAFTDGTSARADVVVGADGVHSTVRGAVTEPSPARYSGMCAFRAIVPAGRAPGFTRRLAQTLWIGPGHHLVHYPVSGGAAVNLVAFAPAGGYAVESWSATATVEEFLAEFTGWDQRLRDLIRQAGTPGRWALLDREPLRRWSRGPVTLLGDAAHPMFPFFAQGAAQAIEDAAVLARCLADDMQAPVRALRRYQSLRIGRTTRLQQVSHARAHVNHLPDGPEQEARDRSLAAADPLAASAWIYAYDAETAAAEAGPDTADGRLAATGRPAARHAFAAKGEPCLVTGRVTGPGGEPLPGALVDVWQASADGFYDVQQPDVQPELNLRGLFTADGDGRFWFRTIVPRFYPIPADGPVGQLLAATGRHPNRPAHIHFIVSAPGYQSVTTHLFVDDSPCLDSDAVFGVKESLVRPFPVVDHPARAAEAGLPNPFRTVHFEVTLLPAGQA
jgi:salicylate hydroxylase